MELPTTVQVDASLKAVLDAAHAGGASVPDMTRVQTWAKGFEVLIRAYDQGGLPQLEKVFLANFEEIKAKVDAAKAAAQAAAPKKGK